jgi:DNA recombination protein RmuC
MIVRLPGERFIAVDAKVSFNAYMEATEATTDEARDAALTRHAASLKDHVRTLAARDYADHVKGDVDLVVLFLPGDPFLSAAFLRDPELQVFAMRSRVLIATPTTLVALLRTVGIYWQQRAVAENAEKIAEVARELYDRAALFGDHLSRVGRGLDSAVDAFNQAVGSFDRRLVPMARRLEELRVLELSKRRLEAPEPVEDEPRSVERTLAAERTLFDDDERR